MEKNNNNKSNKTKNSTKEQKKSGRKPKKKSTLRIVIRVFIILLIIACFAIFGALVGAYFGIISSAEKLNATAVSPEIFSSKIIVDGTGELYATLEGKENREYVLISELPDYVRYAFVAIEDERFYQHDGVDIKGSVRSIVSTLTNKGVQGGSTITQQIIKNNRGLLTNTIETKLQEQYLAIQYEKDMIEAYGSKKQAKDKILEIYINLINLGDDNNGVQTAAKRYFNKNAQDLTISEAAVLAAIPQSPYKHNPVYFPDNNKYRQRTVLEYMLEQGYITESEYTEAINDDVYSRIANYNVEYMSSSFDTYYTDQVKLEVIRDLAKLYDISRQEASYMLFNSGLEIHIPIDLEIQEIVDNAYLNDENFPSAGYKIQVRFLLDVKSASEGKTINYDEITYVKNRDEIEAFEQSVIEKYVGPNDEILAQNTYPVVQPQSSFVVIDNATGYVSAISGGRGEKLADLGLNRASNSTRSPGSTFKILASYAPGFDTGTFGLGDVFDDVPYSVGSHNFRNWYSGYRGLSTAREGIRDSMNIVTVKAMEEVGTQTAFDYLLNFGFTTLVESRTDASGKVYSDIGLSTSLGGLTDGITNVEMTAAYATIANNGEYRAPVFYTKVYNHEGELILDNTNRESRMVIKPTTAYLLISGMIDVVTSGTGTSARFKNLSMPIAGKTGTTSESHDLWFEGFTPYYTAGVWLGYDIPETISDGSYHKRLWSIIMEEIHVAKGLERKEFERPSGINSFVICRESGMLANEYCEFDQRGSTVYSEFFASGTEPTAECTVHVLAKIDTSTGKLATEFCPEALIEERVMIVRPDGFVAEGNVADAQYQLENLGNCEIHDEHSVIDDGVEGIDYYIDPLTGDRVYAEVSPSATTSTKPTSDATATQTPPTQTTTVKPSNEPLPTPEKTNQPTSTPIPVLPPTPTSTTVVEIPEFREN